MGNPLPISCRLPFLLEPPLTTVTTQCSTADHLGLESSFHSTNKKSKDIGTLFIPMILSWHLN
jgi:hypothetical protein